MFKKEKKESHEIILKGSPKGDLEEIIRLIDLGTSFDRGLEKVYLSIIEIEKGLSLGVFIDSRSKEQDIMPKIAEFCHNYLGELCLFDMNNLSKDLVLELVDKSLLIVNRK